MRKFVCIVTVLLSIVVTVKAQDYEALGKFMKKYSQNWARSYNEQIGQPMPSYHFDKKLNSKALKGKFVVLNFWATWCGPCRTANKAITPMKEELKDKDIIYLYITGETSPKGTWENMITDIHGEHFRVTNEQWSFLMSSFNIRGVPTYFVVDPEGNITFKQTGFPGVDTMKKELMKALNK